ncbi:MAG: hypothetical protein G01um101456_502 [Parcubacteria group bacterium Gr01-1014_56]|nr:MAG: hypothetical protein G01um101456_502 [Parcubacteria group bacterium Gr01-1014_56]
MQKILITTAVVIVILVGGFFAFNAYIYQQKQGPVVDYKNTTYRIEGEVVQLTNGRSESEATPGSATKVVTDYFGNEAKGDLNGDGIPDLAFLLTQTSGGSGTFYYVVAAIQTAEGGYYGSNAIFLGDRISPQTTEIREGQVVVNYAERNPGEPMSTEPSVGVSLYLKFSNNELVSTE